MHMISLRILVWMCASIGLVGFSNTRAEENELIHSRNSEMFLAPLDSSDHRKYAPDREIDIVNLALDVTPDFKTRTIRAKATLAFKPIGKTFSELRLDAVDLRVESVVSAQKIQGYQTTDKKLVINFAEPLPAGTEATVTIA